MTIEELEKKLSELEDLHAEFKSQIAKLKERGEEKPKPPHPRWRPIFNENYYYIYEAEVGEHIWVEDGYDQALYSVGNVFMSKDAAKFAAERLKVLAEMQEWAGMWNDVFVLTYVGNDDIVQVGNVLAFRNTFGEMRFATRDDAENCVKAVGKERIKKYYFGISEDEDEIWI